MPINQPDLQPLGLQLVQTGVVPNDGQGDLLYAAFEKVNGNFKKLSFTTSERLTADRTYYVSPTGSDSNDGLTQQTALASINTALAKVYSVYTNGFLVKVRLLDGVYRESAHIHNALDGVKHHSASEVIIEGNVNNPDAVHWRATVQGVHYAGDGIDTVSYSYILRVGENGTVRLRGITFAGEPVQFKGLQHYLVCLPQSRITIENVVFGPGSLGGRECRTQHMVNNGGIFQINGSYDITGSADYHILAFSRGLFDLGINRPYTVQVKNNPTFYSYFIGVYDVSVVDLSPPSIKFIGSAVGISYYKHATAHLFAENNLPTGLSAADFGPIYLKEAFVDTVHPDNAGTHIPNCAWVQRHAPRHSLVPVGGIIAFANTSAPVGYVTCNGTAISRRDFADLFAVIGTRFGAGDGTNTFNVPNIPAPFPGGCSGIRH